MKRAARTPASQLKVTWYGHSAFRFDTPSGKVLLVDPWLDNPVAPHGAAGIDRVDTIFVTHGHSDHIGNTVAIARRTGATVYAIYEVALFLQSQGVAQAVGMNKSGTVAFDGMSATMVDATHSSGIEGGASALAGADPAGFVFRFENGFSVYHAGDTGLFGDMRLIAALYKPDLVILPIGGFYTMGPREAAYACRLLTPKHILGMHYGTFPALSGTPAELKRHLPAPLKSRLQTLTPGGSLTLSRR